MRGKLAETNVDRNDLKTYKIEVAFAPVLDAGEDWAELGVVMAKTDKEAVRRASLTDGRVEGAYYRVTELEAGRSYIITLSE